MTRIVLRGHPALVFTPDTVFFLGTFVREITAVILSRPKVLLSRPKVLPSRPKVHRPRAASFEGIELQIGVPGQEIGILRTADIFVEFRIRHFLERVCGLLAQVAVGALHVREMRMRVAEMLFGRVEHSQHVVPFLLIIIHTVEAEIIRT